MIIPEAVHADLYDNLSVIPFEKIASMVLKIHDSMRTTGIAERISIDPIFKE